MTTTASPETDHPQNTQLFLAVGDTPFQYSDWLTPPPDQEGPLEPITMTVTPERRALRRRRIRFSTGEFVASLNAPGKTVETPEGLRVTRTPEGIVVDTADSPYDLLSVPHQPTRASVAPETPKVEAYPFKGEYAWLSQPTTREELLARSHTYEDFARNSLRPVKHL